ncbi:hypothetical protein H0B56_12180 [Haloechinothrix sp. YIM 98757]|uniref:Homeodomain-like domain-containing protein n=1 Tax=Haloechinothrix aidingensis TaxID=2752311 RepID=A0A838AAN3_9PSEU|nr:hypothetical protein [Haloechinothrix aidingensis]MBA0126300.1 hypothetical protein [Haloechinothrix aidingensis]
MPRKPLPEPREVDRVRALAAELAELEERVRQLRAERNSAMVDAKLAGATGDQLARATGMTRRNVHGALQSAGYDYSSD